MFLLKDCTSLWKGRFAIACGLCLLCTCYSCGIVKQFGREPRGERLERIRQSPHWRDGKFHNPIPFQADESGWFSFSVSLLMTGGDARPSGPIPVEKPDLSKLPQEKDCVIWLGHSSVFLQIDGLRYLVDPVLTSGWPQKWLLSKFKGDFPLRPEEIPEIDAVILTHNHWDHLDYLTIRALQDRVGMFICPLGLGEYLEYWDCPPEKIHELDWGEKVTVGGKAFVHALTAIHGSRRFSARDKTFWMAALIESPGSGTLGRVFVSGDGGYGRHFAEIPRQYGDIDLAIMENGQYNDQFQSVHTRPEELLKEIEMLHPKWVLPYHNSRYALAGHPWKEPLEFLYEHAQDLPSLLLFPRVGECIDFEENDFPQAPWWRIIE